VHGAWGPARSRPPRSALRLQAGPLRKDIDVVDDENDQGTADFLIGLMEQHEQMAWLHRALLEGRPVGPAA
jgi:Ferritin-like domain